LFIGLVIEGGKFEEYLFKLDFKNADYYHAKAYKFYHGIGWMTVICNIVSCILMGLVLRIVLKVSKQAKAGGSHNQS